jgi:general nucleoside transport system permease protein
VDEMMELINTFISQTVVYTTVYALVALGILIAGRAGIFNITGEGILLAAASCGFLVSYFTKNWVLGYITGAVVGAAFGFILEFMHEMFKVNQFIIGMALIILGSGLSDLIYNIFGRDLFFPLAPPTPLVSIPYVTGIPILSGFIKQNVIVYFMYASTIVTWWFFYKTKIGLETRAIGENPKAADVVGIDVVKRRYAMTIIGSSLIGIAGAYLSMILTGTYAMGLAGGRGYMAIGIVVFASWKPERAIIGAFLFAAIEVAAYRLQVMSTGVPYQFFLMLPFVAILIIMIVFKKHVEFPASVGEAYSRE